jgi:methylglutaconyl-CoA hydratase
VSADHVVEHTRGGVRYITLNRPERLNAFDRPMLLSLTTAVQRAGFDSSVRVIVIKANGKAFCAGGDLNYVNELRQAHDERELAEFSNRTEELMTEISLAPKPVIAAVQGLAYAGGLIIVLMADMTIASKSASFCAIQAKRGLLDPYVVGRLSARVGVEKAKWLVFTSRVVDACEAEDMGLISQVVEPGDLSATVDSIADELAGMPPGVLGVFKNMFTEFSPQYQLSTYRAHMATSEARDGVAEFIGRTR